MIGWIFFGLLVGIVAKLLLPGKDPGGFILTDLSRDSRSSDGRLYRTGARVVYGRRSGRFYDGSSRRIHPSPCLPHAHA